MLLQGCVLIHKKRSTRGDSALQLKLKYLDPLKYLKINKIMKRFKNHVLKAMIIKKLWQQ